MTRHFGQLSIKKRRYGTVSGREYTYDYKTICAEFDDGVSPDT